MVKDLPKAARGFFVRTLAPGARLASVVEVEMSGLLDLSRTKTPKWKSMRARQIIALPHGFIWDVDSGALSGTDGLVGDTSWSRFNMLGFIPVGRAGGADHFRSAFGRMVADALMWAPASLLPRDGIVWTGDDDRHATVTVTRAGCEQAVHMRTRGDGTLESLWFERWSDANPDGVYRLQPFGGDVSGFAMFDGCRLPTQVVAGNHYGTPDYRPFFRTERLFVTAVRPPT